MRKILTAGLIASGLFAANALAVPSNAEFGGKCAQGLAEGKMVDTDCSINWTDEKSHKMYCFSSNGNKAKWAQSLDENMKKAQENFANLSKGTTTTSGATAEHKG